MDTLQKYKDKPLYEVPEHFFEQLQHDIMQRVANEKKQQKTFKKWISVASAAASFALIVSLSVFLFVNRSNNEHFYVYEEVVFPEDSIISLDVNYLVEVNEPIHNLAEDVIVINEPLAKNEPPVETIVYRAVDYYVDDYETDNFYETMYDLECYYDY